MNKYHSKPFVPALFISLLCFTMAWIAAPVQAKAISVGSMFSPNSLRVPKPKTETLATGVKLSWKPTVGAIGYRIYRGEKDNWKKSKKIGQTIYPQFFDKTGKPGVDYYYWACPVAYPSKFPGTYGASPANLLKKWLSKGKISNKPARFSGKSTLGWRAVEIAWPTMAAYGPFNEPATSKLKDYNKNVKGIKISWKKAKGAIGYLVYRLEDKTMRKNYSAWKKAQHVGTSKTTSFLDKDSNLKPGFDYRYWVVPFGKNKRNYLDVILKDRDALDESAFPRLYGVGMRKSTVVVPVPSVCVSYRTAHVNIQWTYDEYVQRFDVYRSRYSGELGTCIGSLPNARGGYATLDDYPLAPGTYYYRIVVRDLWNSPWRHVSGGYATVTVPKDEF